MNIYLRALMNILEESKHEDDFVFIGNCAFLKRMNGNNIKVYVSKYSLVCETISRANGSVDKTELPFSNYFAPKRLSPKDVWWDQHIDGDDWYFGKTHWDLVPTNEDYINIAVALDDYIFLFG